jgi:TonB-linked SusC/RagA family outer membrane protein
MVQDKKPTRELSDTKGVGTFTSNIRTLSFLTIVIAFCCFSSTAFAQTASISGKVTDADTKEGLPGVTVLIPNLKIGAKTDGKGNYKIINVPVGKHSIEARLIGYKNQSVSVTIDAGVGVSQDFVLFVRALQQNEIVVLGLSGEIDRSKLGNVIGSVDGTEIANATSQTAIDAVAGRVPGVSVTRNSGTPGAGTYITIRGRKTISGSSQPLYVVDGVVMDNTSIQDQNFQNGEVQLANRIVDINPADIESMEILKGASAAAIYGSQAANGVVLITTKKGKAKPDGNANITFTANYESGEASNSYPLQTSYGQGVGGVSRLSNLSYGPKLDTMGNPTTYEQWKVPLRTAAGGDVNLTISGGNQSFNYLLSGTYTDIDGIVQSSELDRKNIRLNLGGGILPKVDVQTANSYFVISNPLPQDGSNLSGIMLGALRTSPEFDNSVVYNEDGSQHNYFPIYDNPLWSQQNNTFTTNVGRFVSSTSANWDPLDWLRVSGRIGLDRYDQTNIERLAVGSQNSGGLGAIEHHLVASTSVNSDISATFNWEPIDELDVTALIGGQTLWTNYEDNVVSGTPTLSLYDEISAASTKDGNSTIYQTKLVGQFAQATGTLNDRLSLTLAIRRDGSSTFGESQKFHWYPKASFAYNISKEDFMQGSKDVISELKLRGSYGEAGAPGTPGVYSTNNLYSTFGNNDGWGRLTTAGRNGMTGIRQGSGTDLNLFGKGAIDISPEINVERELGFDLGLFDNRINIEFSYYYANIYDMILNVPVPGSSGYDNQLRNAGSMHNEGIEISLGAWPVRNEDVSWNTVFNFSKNENMVDQLNVKPDLDGVIGSDDAIPIYGFTGIENVAMVGKALGVFRGGGYRRDANGNIMVYTSTDANDPFGQIGKAFVGAPMIDFDSSHIIGDPNADFIWSWKNDITFLKDFNLSFLVDASVGGDVWNGTRGALYRFGTHADTKDRDELWSYNGNPVLNSSGNQVKKVEYYRYYGNSFTYDIDEAVIEDGSYVKLREISLSYKLHGLEDVGIDNVTFTLSARNLYTWTDYTGFDPEVNTFAQSEARGYDYFNLPAVRTFRFGVSLQY